MRLPLKDYNDRWIMGRIHDEAMIARELQASGMNRTDALRVAASHVAKTNLHGLEMGRVVNIGRELGDNGGPLLDEFLT